jgi:hypothetical protein
MEANGGNQARIHNAATLCRIAHIVLAVKHKLIHGDAHIGNVMVSDTETGWVDRGVPGRALLIDFGRTVEITAAQHADMVRPLETIDYPHKFHRILTFIRDYPLAIPQNANWLNEPLFAGENINDDLNTTTERLTAHWAATRCKWMTLPSIAALGATPTSPDVERTIKSILNRKSLFGPAARQRAGKRTRRRQRKGARRTRSH